MKITLFVTGLLALLELCACASVDALCRTTLEIDCATDYTPEGDETVCATDGHTYVDLCTFSKAKCLTSSIKISHFGACSGHTVPPHDSASTSASHTTVTTTAATTTVTTTPLPLLPSLDESEMVKRVFCQRKDSIDCADDVPNPYCGSNGILYPNECEFVKAQCDEVVTRQTTHICDGHGHDHVHI